MHPIVFVSLLVLFVSAASVEITEEEVNAMFKVFCNEDYETVAEKMKTCFDEIEISDNGKKVLEECCEGMETPLTGVSVQTYICDHSPDEMMQCMKCQVEEFTNSGDEEKYNDITGDLRECLEREAAKSDE